MIETAMTGRAEKAAKVPMQGRVVTPVSRLAVEEGRPAERQRAEGRRAGRQPVARGEAREPTAAWAVKATPAVRVVKVGQVPGERVVKVAPRAFQPTRPTKCVTTSTTIVTARSTTSTSATTES